MTKIKICGLKSEDDISYVNELKPDYIGFVFLQGRKRYVSPSQASHLKGLLDPSIPAVGVFVNEPLEQVIALAKSGTIQMIQLHGQEDEAYLKELRKHCSQPVIKAFIIKTKEDMEKALSFSSDYLLLDNGLGTGEAFDWSLIQNIDRPFFLAGGLNPGNAASAIKLAHPYALDVSSGVETDGKKDYEKIKAFIHAVRTTST
ncbi:MAG: phosphoribosylanthranilate isomerase [Lachnospiraceae bacterium]|nr:phosphoribosylanthranilate isomerase [Lachnospiraceae bacterium]